jgi:hypothetical protein
MLRPGNYGLEHSMGYIIHLLVQRRRYKDKIRISKLMIYDLLVLLDIYRRKRATFSSSEMAGDRTFLLPRQNRPELVVDFGNHRALHSR